MIETLSAIGLTTVLVHTAFFLCLVAFVLTDLLWLRLVIIAAYLLFGASVLIEGGERAGAFLPWYAAFIVINAVSAGRLAHERYLARLTEEERALYDAAFALLDRSVFKRFLRLGRWRTLTAGDTITVAGRVTPHLVLIAAGEVAVLCDGRLVTTLSTGSFVGEVGFVARRSATATVRVPAGGAEPVRALLWDVGALRKAMQRDQELRGLVHAAVGADLAEKVAKNTLRLIRPTLDEIAHDAAPATAAPRERQAAAS